MGSDETDGIWIPCRLDDLGFSPEQAERLGLQLSAPPHDQ
jgi:hypothetical protein